MTGRQDQTDNTSYVLHALSMRHKQTKGVTHRIAANKKNPSPKVRRSNQYSNVETIALLSNINHMFSSFSRNHITRTQGEVPVTKGERYKPVVVAEKERWHT